jgi:hypothetical protein
MAPLDRLIAIDDIRQLKARYFRFMDVRDWGALGQVFCRDALFDCREGFVTTALDGKVSGFAAPVTHGRDAILAWIADAFADQTSCHHGHAHEVTILGKDEATGIVAMEDYIFGPDRATLRYHGAGHYHERYRMEDGEWRIAETRLTRLFSHLAD